MCERESTRTNYVLTRIKMKTVLLGANSSQWSSSCGLVLATSVTFNRIYFCTTYVHKSLDSLSSRIICFSPFHGIYLLTKSFQQTKVGKIWQLFQIRYRRTVIFNQQLACDCLTTETTEHKTPPSFRLGKHFVHMNTTSRLEIYSS